MTFRDQASALRRMFSDKVQGSYPGMPIIWPNELADPPAPPAIADPAKPWLGSYLRFYIRFDVDGTQHFEHTDMHRLLGIVTVGVFVPKGMGFGYLEEIGWEVARIFRDVRIESFRFFRGPLLGPAFLDEGEAHAYLNVTADFVANAAI